MRIKIIIIIIAKVNKMEVHQASIYNKKFNRNQIRVLFLSTWSHNAIVVDSIFVPI